MPVLALSFYVIDVVDGLDVIAVVVVLVAASLSVVAAGVALLTTVLLPSST